MSYAPEALLPNPLVSANLVASLIEQYKQPRVDGNPPRLAGILASLGSELQYLDNMWQEMLPLLNISAMVGPQLDTLGRICNVARGGLSDAAYTPVLIAAFQTNISGTPNQILAALVSAFGGTAAYFPQYPAGFTILLNGGAGNAAVTTAQIRRLAPAGVGANLGSWLALYDSDPSPYPYYLQLYDTSLYPTYPWLLIDGGDLIPQIAPSVPSIIFDDGASIVAVAAVNISAWQLVGINSLGDAVLANASVPFVEAVGVAATSVSAGSPVTILQNGLTGPIGGASWTAGQLLYLGLTGNWATTPPGGTGSLSQQVGTAATTNTVAINIQQGILL